MGNDLTLWGIAVVKPRREEGESRDEGSWFYRQEKRGMNEWRRIFGVAPERRLGGRAWKGQRVQEQDRGGRKQREN